MDWLLTLLAFAGVMAFLSTLLSVFVEGLHKLFGWRRAGLEEMLRSLHANVLTRLDPQTAGLDTSQFTSSEDRASARFARGMTENVAFSGFGRFWWLRNIPILSWFFQRRHERLSTLQYIEHLATSEIGAALQTLSRPQRQRALTAAAYEFERYGDAQSSYFQSRARVLSVFFALIFAFAINIDALELYKRLRNDATVRDVFAHVNVDQLEAQSRGAAAGGATPEARQLQAGVVQGVQQLRAQGIQIGYTAFPYCVSAPGVGTTIDARCIGPPSPTPSLSDAWKRFWASDVGWLWLLSVIAAGGLIGLGAPFWYQVFRRIASIVPAAQTVRAVLQPETAPTPSPSGQATGVRNPNAASADALLLAFDVASGTVANSVTEPNIQTALDPTHQGAPTIVRGDGSVSAQNATSTRHLR